MQAPAALAANPFALMMQPQAVFETIERSDALRGLRRRFHLLDETVPQRATTMAVDADEDDPELASADFAFPDGVDDKGFPTLVN